MSSRLGSHHERSGARYRLDGIPDPLRNLYNYAPSLFEQQLFAN